MKDYELLSIVSGALATIAFFASFSWAVFGQVLAPCLIIGGIILLVRRGILKTAKGISRIRNEKKQAV